MKHFLKSNASNQQNSGDNLVSLKAMGILIGMLFI